MKKYLFILFCSPLFAEAAIPPGVLTELQAKIDTLEVEIAEGRKTSAGIDQELAKLKRLFHLQQLEVQLGKNEIASLEKQLAESEAKQVELEGKISGLKQGLRQGLSQLPAFGFESPLMQLRSDERALTDMHKEVIENSVRANAKQLGELKKLQAELSELNENLRQDKFRLAARLEDLEERQKVLTLNRELASHRLHRTREAEESRTKEIQAARASEKKLAALASRIAQDTGKPTRIGTDFLAAKGRLEMPVDGELAHEFGKKYDPKTNLYTFHKGIEISAKGASPVRAVFPGKVAFVGRLGGYRQLLIIDHGKQFYSLVGNIGEALKKTGDSVRAGEEIARSSADASALYFEIRQRHIAVNPLPWFRERKLIARNSER